MPLSESYINAIRRFEGFTPRPMWDYKQYSSGYGTRGRPGEVIDRAEADRRLRSELTSARDRVRGLGVAMHPGQEAALTSLTFNSGDAWTRAGLGQAVRAGNWDEAKRRLLQYVNAGGQPLPGLIERRRQEASWLGGPPPETSLEAQEQPASITGSQQSQPPAAPMGAPRMPIMEASDMSQGQGLGDYFSNLSTNPLLMMGLTTLMGQGPAVGANAATQAARARMQQMEFAEKLAQRRRLQGIWAQAFPGGQPAANHPLTKGVPPELLATAYAAGPEAGVEMLGKLAMTGATQKLSLQQEEAKRRQMIEALSPLFMDQPQPAQQSAPDPFAQPAAVMPTAGPTGVQGMAVAQPGATPAQIMPPQMAQPQAQQAQQPGLSVAPSAMANIWRDPDLKRIVMGNLATGNTKGAFDAIESAAKQYRDLQLAGPTEVAKQKAQEAVKMEAGRTPARVNISTAINSLGRLKAEAEAIRDDPALGRITGLYGQVWDAPGSAASDVRARLKSLTAQIGFSVLQAIREASKTGGALGQVSDKELANLQNALAGLDTKQSKESFRRNLQQVINYTKGAEERLKGGYRETYGQEFSEPGGAQPQTFGNKQSERRTLNGKRYIKQNGQWFEE